MKSNNFNQLFVTIFFVIILAFNSVSSVFAQYSNCDSSPCGSSLGNYTESGQMWNKALLKYYFINGTADIDGDGEKTAFEIAFDTWSAVAPLKFQEVFSQNQADIKIHFADGTAFSTTGASESARAVAYFPEQDCKGVIVINDGAYIFSLSSTQDVDLVYVALHEIGHVLGLCHSKNSSTVMYGEYSSTSKRTLHSYDIQGIQAIYPSISLKAENSFSGGDIYVNDMNNSKTAPYNWTIDNGADVPITLGAIEQNDGTFDRVWNTSGSEPSISNWRIQPYGSQNQTPIIGATNTNYYFSAVQSDHNAIYIADLKKNYEINRKDDCSEFDNVINNPGVTYIVEQNNGTITAPTSKSVNGKTYNFTGWTDDFSEANPRTITPTDNETYTALYKYPRHSNSSSAYNNESQRKFVRTTNGYLHHVYESMDKIWYETSSDNGSSWEIANDGKPLNNGDDASSPAIENLGNDILITYLSDGGMVVNVESFDIEITSGEKKEAKNLIFDSFRFPISHNAHASLDIGNL